MTQLTAALAAIPQRAIAILALLAVMVIARPAPAATPAEVDAAIQKGKKFLYSQQQKRDGTWETAARGQVGGEHWGGPTCIATYALLVAGESHQDPRIAKALDFLYRADIDSIYALGLRGQIWNLLPPSKKVTLAAKRDRDLLLKSVNQAKGNPLLGLYGYTTAGGGEHNSPAQYGVLGVWGTELAGAEVPSVYWALVDAAWKNNQDASGGWGYQAKVGPMNPAKASMTAAGVATLFITQDYLHANDGVKCTGNITNTHIEAGMKWLADNFAQVGADGYTLYGIERIGVASGYKYFGKTDWYATGAETLVRGQATDGSWATHGPVPGTCFGLVFLTRGRAPVMFNKLDYSGIVGLEPGKFDAKPKAAKKGDQKKKERHWNQRPRDAANVVHWLGNTLERDLNWQIVNLKAPVDELHDAPVLYIAGDQTLDFGAEDIAKLKQFVEQGGLILGNADCAKPAFAQSFMKLGQKMFPRYEFRDLPQDHPIYTRQLFPAKGKRVGLMGLTNGVREMMLLIARDDSARSWQTRSDRTKGEAFQIGANIFLYSVDKKNLRNKGETYIVKDAGVKPERTMKVVRLAVGTNPDPEPGGWRRIGNVLRNGDKVGLEITEAKPGEGKLTGAKVAHLTGTSDFKLDAKAREELLAFVKGGGTLIVDAAGGKTPFADAAERELGATFGSLSKKGMDVIPPKHPLYTDKLVELKDVSYREFARETLKNLNAPRVRAIDVGKGRLGVLYSREDLSAGMVGQPVDGIHGYEPATATRLMRSMLLYALYDGAFPKPAPPAAPAPAAPAPATPPPAPATPAPATPAPATPAPATPAPATPAPATPAPATPAPAAPAPAAPATPATPATATPAPTPADAPAAAAPAEPAPPSPKS